MNQIYSWVCNQTHKTGNWIRFIHECATGHIKQFSWQIATYKTGNLIKLCDSAIGSWFQTEFDQIVQFVCDSAVGWHFQTEFHQIVWKLQAQHQAIMATLLVGTLSHSLLIIALLIVIAQTTRSNQPTTIFLHLPISSRPGLRSSSFVCEIVSKMSCAVSNYCLVCLGFGKDLQLKIRRKNTNNLNLNTLQINKLRHTNYHSKSSKDWA